MAENDVLAERFEASRAHLRTVAYRMLGSSGEADDAVQEAWLRLARADASEVHNLRGWLTTVVARVCPNMLRARQTRREDAMGADVAETIAGADDVARDAELADSMGVALLVVMETLAPAERVAFVLHDLFNLPFDEIAPILDRSPAAARQLASRARRRLQGSPAQDADRARQREVVEAFLAASRGGDFAALLAVLDPDVVLRADAAAVQASLARVAYGAPQLASEVRGARAVADTFRGRAQAAQLASVDGAPGLVFAPGGRPRVVFDFVVEDGRIVEIRLIADPASIGAMALDLTNAN